MQISKRLRTVASFVTEGNSIADIGTDHAYVPIFLAKEGKITKALAMDIKKGPLERAKTHIQKQGLSDMIEVRLSDGLSAFQKGEAETIIISGMGGALLPSAPAGLRGPRGPGGHRAVRQRPEPAGHPRPRPSL